VTQCETLSVVDVLEEALTRCHDRLGDNPKVTYTQADISETASLNATYDLIVFSEVVCYLGSQETVSEVVRRMVTWLNDGGHLLLVSGTDRTVRRWGYACGAETALRVAESLMTVVEHRLCVGATDDECSMIALLKCNPGRSSADDGRQ
jgi:2-polyprenyl-3-methyl-5-hydroxy-6-metoxy-1,4-benzoquinol methylase